MTPLPPPGIAHHCPVCHVCLVGWNAPTIVTRCWCCDRPGTHGHLMGWWSDRQHRAERGAA